MNVCVITGGGSGMGLEVAKLVDRNQKIILVGRTLSKLENALNELKELGIDAESYAADASDRESIEKLAQYAASLGTIKTVIHSAGVSPHMADGEKIFAINAIGTINVDEIFAPLMNEGGCILNVASMAGHMLPSGQEPIQMYQLALSSPDALMAAAKQMLTNVPEAQVTGTAYTISKNFVLWYTRQEAVKYGAKGLRVVSISPGTFSTPMGNLEGEEAASFAKMGALKRVGDPKEIAEMMAFMVSDKASYLTGTDILYDGGSIAALEVMKANKH